MVDEHEDQRITCLMLSWIAQIILKDQAYSEYRITSKSKTVHITIAHHLFVRRNISPITMCNHRHLHRLSVHILSSVVYHCDLIKFTAVDCVRYPSYNQRNQATWTCKAPADSSQNGGAEYRVYSFKYGPWTMM